MLPPVTLRRSSLESLHHAGTYLTYFLAFVHYWKEEGREKDERRRVGGGGGSIGLSASMSRRKTEARGVGAKSRTSDEC